MNRRKIFIIHGKAITFQEAILQVAGVLKSKVYYFKQPRLKKEDYYIPADHARFLRYVIYENHSNLFMKELANLLVTKIVISQYFTDNDFKPDDKWSPLSSFKINQQFEQHGISSREKAQREFCDKKYNDTRTKLASILGCPNTELDAISGYLCSIAAMLGNEQQGMYFERDAGDAIVNVINQNSGNGKEIIKALIEVKRNQEIGGDLDTIGSNVLYGIWAIHTIPAETGEQAVYGRDFIFDFVNYHEGLSHLTKYSNCDIYIPDFPIDAIPDFSSDVDSLLETGNIIVSYDDHHPWTQEGGAALTEAYNSGKIRSFSLSNLIKGEEQPKEEQKCGTDMVYEKFIQNTDIDNEAIQELVRLAHVQDLHIMEDKMALDLSKLIGSKHSKLDMVQQLMLIQSKQDLDNIMQSTGWDKKVKQYEYQLTELCPRLEENMGLIQFTIPPDPENLKKYFEEKMSSVQKTIAKIVKILSFGTYDMTNFFYKFDRENRHRIFLLLSPQQSQKEAKINVASAINYFQDKIKYDYMFYCYGSSLLTMRKINSEDESLDLSIFAEQFGEGGGHREAASCKPTANEHFPKKFQRVNSSNFEQYIGYIAHSIGRMYNYQIVKYAKLMPFK